MEDFSIKNLAEFDNHRCVFLLEDTQNGLTAFIAIHRGGLKYPAFGATRFWNYPSKTDAIRDSLRLSKMMSYKSALAGLQYGGAKAVIMDNNKMNPQERKKVLMSYAERLNYLNGKFITGTDMGLQPSDLDFMKKKTDFLVGLHIDPTHYTTLGLMEGLTACLKEIFGKTTLVGRTFAIEGMGKIGKELLKNIYGKAEKIYVTDLKRENLEQIKKDFPKVKIVEPKELAKLKVDVYAPCGSNGSLNTKSISFLRAKIIIGGANNQLEKPEIGERLHRSGILYAPDYVANAGGLMSVVHEFEHQTKNLHLLEKKIKKIGKNLQEIFRESQRSNIPPFAVANAMAEKIITQRF